MDKVLRDTLITNLQDAADDTDLRAAMTLAMMAVVECQQKTSMRVKYLFWLITVLTAAAAGEFAKLSLAEWLARF